MIYLSLQEQAATIVSVGLGHCHLLISWKSAVWGGQGGVRWFLTSPLHGRITDLEQAMFPSRQGRPLPLTPCKAQWWRASQEWRLMKRTWASVDHWTPLGQVG